MKKLYISCPMKGRTKENIAKSMYKLHKIAEIVFEQELEVIDTYIEDALDKTDAKNPAIHCLGESITKMAEADYFVGLGGCEGAFRGCAVESHAASAYHIERLMLPLWVVAPDAKEQILTETCA